MAESQTHETPPRADAVQSKDDRRGDDREARGSEPDPQLLRALADLDNLRKRYERQLATASRAERARVTSLWLPVVDDLERALQHTDDGDGDGGGGPMAEGLRAVYEHAVSVLAGLGFVRFDDVGRPFDPVRDEAVGAVDADAPPGRIVATVRPGYQDGDQVIRPARVVVARAPE
jgi:molecular chaperone GrpE